MDEERLSQLYNLIINPGTRDWERSQLLAARDRLESGQEQKNVLSELEAALRPLALRGNLTPDLQDFYDQLRGIETTQTTQKTKTHQITDWSHQETAIFAGVVFGVWWSLLNRK